MPADQMTQFVAVAQVTQQSLGAGDPANAPADARAILTEYVRTKELKADVLPAAIALSGSLYWLFSQLL